jgi:signal transduction histidine kinase/CheY-like chemotaxis protein
VTALQILNDECVTLIDDQESPIVIVGLDATIRSFTASAHKYFNLVPHDLGRSIGDITPDFEAPNLNSIVSDVIQSLTRKVFKVSDRKGRWFRLVVRPYVSPVNGVEGAVLSLVDFSLFNHMHRESETLPDYAMAVADTLLMPLVVLDGEMRVEWANESFGEMFAVVPHKDIGLDIFSIFGSKGFEIPGVREKLGQVFSGLKVLKDFEITQEFPDLGRRTFILNARQIRTKGSLPKALLLSIDDITERRNAELSQTLSRKLLDKISHLGRIGGWQLDFSQKTLTWSDVTKQLHEVDADYEPTLESALSFYKEGKSRDAIVAAIDQGLKSGKPWNLELTLVTAKGREILVQAIGEVVTRKGVPVLAYGTFHDVTESRSLEMAVERSLIQEKVARSDAEAARAQAEAANRTKDEFLAILSHELRTPLSAILGWAQLLRMGQLNAESVSHAFEIIEKSAKAQSQLIDDLLDVSRILSGKLKLHIQRVDPKEIILAAIDSTRSFAATKSILVTTSLDSSIKEISADPMRLQQILWNLINNSIKFSPESAKIWITLERFNGATSEQVRLRVRDNGKGIRADFFPSLFTSFSQFDSSRTRSQGGLGLGLALARELTEMHHGSIEAESPGEGKGSTFSVCLPLVSHEDLSSVTIVDEAEDASVSAATLRGLRVMVVDDEANAREVFSAALESFGAIVQTAESVAHALRVIEDFQPDVILSDIGLPGEDGYSLMRKIRSMNSKLGQTPAIALTAFAGQEDVQRALLAGFQSHISKPVDLKKLALAIDQISGRK